MPHSSAHPAPSVLGWLPVVFGITAMAFAGCQSPRKLSSMEMESLRKESSISTLRLLTLNYVDRYATHIEGLADRIIEQSPDPQIRENALLWKINTISAAISSVDHHSALASLLDTWSMAAQVHQFVASTNGTYFFGTAQPMAVNVVAELELQIAAEANEFLKPATYAEVRQLVARWVREHPIQDVTSERPSGAAALFKQYAEVVDGDILSMAYVFEEELQVMRAIFALKMEWLPRRSRWQAERLVSSTLEHEVQPLVELALDRLSDERALVLTEVDRQRKETLETLQSEREILVTTVQTERAALMETVVTQFSQAISETERIFESQLEQALQKVDRQRSETVEILRSERLAVVNGMERISENMLDRFYQRLWFVLGVVWVGLALLLLFARLLFSPRRTTSGEPAS